jgi:hypothetical protein
MIDKFTTKFEIGSKVQAIKFAKECEQVADEFAIGFGEWMTSGVEFVDDTKRGRIYEYKHKKYTTKELLEIYKL